jgi:hypothetical protein
VGRLELITPASERALEHLIATHDLDGVLKYGRFLEPMMEQLKADNPTRAAQFDDDLSQTYSAGQPQPAAP